MTDAPHRVSELESGLRVVTEAVPSVRSVALGIWIGTGSRNEPEDQAGVSHFLEHMLFKGTERHSASGIAQIFDGLGGSLNAATGKEATHLHARFLDAHTERALEVMADMLLAPAYPEIDSEREVVLEEIAMYEDEPQDKVHDLLGEAVFGSHPLGRAVIGRAEVISSIPLDAVAAYHRSRYVAPSIVVSAAGNLEHERIVELCRRYIEPPAAERPPERPDGAPAEPAPQILFRAKETEQYHICLGGPGIARGDERRFALAVVDSILGGSPSSRLFQEIREKRGLAYSVGSYNEEYVDAGMVALYVGTREENVDEACGIIARELERLHTESVSAEELARGKEHVKGRLVLAMESMSARMARLGKALLLGTPLYTIDEMLARVDALGIEDLSALAGQLYGPERFSAACIGPGEERFRTALRPVSEAAAAA